MLSEMSSEACAVASMSLHYSDLLFKYFEMKSSDFKTVHEYCVAFGNVRLASSGMAGPSTRWKTSLSSNVVPLTSTLGGQNGCVRQSQGACNGAYIFACHYIAWVIADLRDEASLHYVENSNSRRRRGKKGSCPHYGHYPNECWKDHPEQAPDWHERRTMKVAA